jgi:phage shock protein PspC (stress-responsive transcriptional regulator)
MNEYKRLTRSRTNRQLAGVCGGLGEYFGVDPTVFRVAFVVVTIFAGTGLLLYIVLALVIPEAENPL